MKLFKKFICFISGKRDKLESSEFVSVSSILLKPIGDAVGDAIAHTAHLNQLKKFNPNLQIGVIVSQRNRYIFENSQLVNKLIDDKFFNYLLERQKWELYVDFQPNYTTRSIVLDRILSPKKIMLFNKEYKKYYNPSTVNNYNYLCNIPQGTHISEYLNLSPLSQVSIENENNYVLNSKKRTDKKDIKIIICPQGSGREIPAEEIKHIILGIDNNLLEKYKIILSLVKNKEEYFNKVNLNNITLLPTLNLGEYIDQINISSLVISVDSGSVHIASAFNKPLLAFYANNYSNLSRWYPKMPDKNKFKVILNKEAKNSNDTANFPIKDAIDWLNLTLKDLLNDYEN